MEQRIITARDNYTEFDQWIMGNGCRKLLLVCDDSILYMDGFSRHLEEMEKAGTRIIRFRDFRPNPLYESVVKGVQLFRAEGCDSIMAVGGGSAMDVAKCIKLYSDMPGDGDETPKIHLYQGKPPLYAPAIPRKGYRTKLKIAKIGDFTVKM